jgi:hypothetical protein
MHTSEHEPGVVSGNARKFSKGVNPKQTTTSALSLILLFNGGFAAMAQDKKPNILVIMGDDIGWYNPSIYNRGEMLSQVGTPDPGVPACKAVLCAA